MCSSDTRATVLDWLVGDGELAQVMATHLRLERRKIQVKPTVENKDKYPPITQTKPATFNSNIFTTLSAFCASLHPEIQVYEQIESSGIFFKDKVTVVTLVA